MSAPGAYAKGVPIIRKFPFAYNTSGILTGVSLYTPRVGDILLDAWVEVTEAWDGTNPRCDVGAFLPGDSHYGYWAQTGLGDPINVSSADAATSPGGLNGGSASSQSLVETIAAGGENSGRVVPGRFTTADPIKAVVTQDGKNNGADTEATQGAAILYLVTATPL